MEYWIDYNMIMDEIRFHRENAQDRIKKYRELKKERELSEGEEWLYAKEVGREAALVCLLQWCEDFKFSTDDLMQPKEKRFPTKELEIAANEYAEKHGFRVPYE